MADTLVSRHAREHGRRRWTAPQRALHRSRPRERLPRELHERARELRRDLYVQKLARLRAYSLLASLALCLAGAATGTYPLWLIGLVGLMADALVIDNDVTAGALNKSDRTQAFTSPSVGYQFIVLGGAQDLVYRKTADGGATWGSDVAVLAGETVSQVSIWYDKWASGGTGTRIHIAYCEDNGHNVNYNYLDTASDTLGTEVEVFDGASVTAEDFCSIAKMRGGNIVIAFDIDQGTETGFYRSTDNGATFGARANLNEATFDHYSVYPGGDADTNDAWAIFVDRSANAISLKVYDDSGDSWSEAAITGFTDVSMRTEGFGFCAATRHSDNHLIVAFFTAYDGGSLLVYDITNAGTITAKTNITTTIDDMYNPCIFIDQTTDRIYVGYIGKNDGSETLDTTVTPFFVYSDDDGATWSAEQTYGETARNHEGMWSDLGGVNSRFIPSFNDVANADLYVNAANSVAVGADPPAGGGSRRLLVGVGR